MDTNQCSLLFTVILQPRVGLSTTSVENPEFETFRNIHCRIDQRNYYNFILRHWFFKNSDLDQAVLHRCGRTSYEVSRKSTVSSLALRTSGLQNNIGIIRLKYVHFPIIFSNTCQGNFYVRHKKARNRMGVSWIRYREGNDRDRTSTDRDMPETDWWCCCYKLYFQSIFPQFISQCCLPRRWLSSLPLVASMHVISFSYQRVSYRMEVWTWNPLLLSKLMISATRWHHFLSNPHE